MEAKRISDIPGGTAVVKTTHRIEELVGKEVVISKVEIREGLYGEMAVVTGALPGGEMFTFITGGQVILRQLKAISPYLPVIATVERSVSKRGRAYYVLI